MSAKAVNSDISIVSSMTLGALWGISDRRVRQLKKEGVISEVSRGKYNITECTQNYCKYLRKKVTGKIYS